MTSHILVAEDNAPFRRSLCFSLERHGYSVSHASDGLKALSRMTLESTEGSAVDLLITDMRMPGLGGVELFKKLREHGDTTPVLFITGHGDKTSELAVAALNCDLLRKPFEESEVIKKVSEHLELKLESSSA